jgi:hypothetical protein
MLPTGVFILFKIVALLWATTIPRKRNMQQDDYFNARPDYSQYQECHYVVRPLSTCEYFLILSLIYCENLARFNAKSSTKFMW